LATKQQDWPVPPHGTQVLPSQIRFSAQGKTPWQQAPPAAPQSRQVPLMQPPPFVQVLPAQQFWFVPPQVPAGRQTKPFALLRHCRSPAQPTPGQQGWPCWPQACAQKPRFTSQNKPAAQTLPGQQGWAELPQSTQVLFWQRRPSRQLPSGQHICCGSPQVG
jgi:hypothetical protein